MRGGGRRAALLAAWVLLATIHTAAPSAASDGDTGGDATPDARLVLEVEPGFEEPVRALAIANGARVVPIRLAGSHIVVEAERPSDFAAVARAWPHVRSVTEDSWNAPAFVFRPNDPSAGQQWAHPVVGLPEAWTRTTGGDAAIVAILDTGADLDHPDLAPALWVDPATGRRGFNVVNPTVEPWDDLPLCRGHGTHVAGIAGARVNNGVGVAGAANVQLMIIKVFREVQSEGKVKCLAATTDIASAVTWARDHGADVISMSFGARRGDDFFEGDAMRYAADRGVLLVAGAGNDGCDDCPFHPAAYPEVIAVANLATAAATDATSNAGAFVDIAAPGTNILSTCTGGTYCRKSGTSMSTPLVSGILALKLSSMAVKPRAQPGCVDPSTPPSYCRTAADGVRSLLEATAIDLGPAERDNDFGHGRVDAAALLHAPSVASIQDHWEAQGILGPAEPSLFPYPAWKRFSITLTDPSTLVGIDIAWQAGVTTKGLGDESEVELRIADFATAKEIGAWATHLGGIRTFFHLPPGSYDVFLYNRAGIPEDFWLTVRSFPETTSATASLPHARMIAGTLTQGVTPAPVLRLPEETLESKEPLFGPGWDLIPGDPDVSFHRLTFMSVIGGSAVVRFQALPVPGTEAGHLLDDVFKLTLKDDATNGVIAFGDVTTSSIFVMPAVVLAADAKYHVDVLYKTGAASDIQLEVATA